MPARIDATAKKPAEGRQLASVAQKRPVVIDKSAYEKLAESYPTYEVRVYRDAGKRGTGSRAHRLLEPQVPFGYFVTHEGPLEGWRAKLEGVGVTLTEIFPGYFKVKVPEGGSVRVKTTIEAIEPNARPWWRCDCAATSSPSRAAPVGVIALVASLALFGARRRERGS